MSRGPSRSGWGRTVAWETSGVPEIVDPSPVAEERLRALAAKHEPRIHTLEAAIASASPDELKGLPSQLKKEKVAYARHRRSVKTLRGPGMTW